MQVFAIARKYLALCNQLQSNQSRRKGAPMDEEKKEIKKVKSYSLPPRQIAWLRNQARDESTDEETVSASAVLERIIDEAMKRSESPSPSKKKEPATGLKVALAA
jgi:hypothetical protein